jgi:cilia- and flagella-associated protein 57
VEEMDVELSSYHKSNAALELMIGELRLKIDGMQREIDNQHGALANVQNYLAVFRRDLMGCHSPEYKQLKSNIRSIFAKYVQQQGNVGGNSGGVDPQQEYNREREHLERNVEALKKKMSKDMDMLMGDHARLTREGVNLTEEMNLLRREAKILKRQQKSMDMEAEGIASSGGQRLLPPPPPQHSVASEAQKELEMQESQVN